MKTHREETRLRTQKNKTSIKKWFFTDQVWVLLSEPGCRRAPCTQTCTSPLSFDPDDGDHKSEIRVRTDFKDVFLPFSWRLGITLHNWYLLADVVAMMCNSKKKNTEPCRGSHDGLSMPERSFYHKSHRDVTQIIRHEVCFLLSEQTLSVNVHKLVELRWVHREPAGAAL